MKLQSIIKPRKHISEALKERGAFSLIGRDPYVDWVGEFLVTTIVMLVLVIASAIVYTNIGKSANQTSATPQSNSKVSMEIKTLDTVLNEFEKREGIRNNLINSGYAGYGDPSL